MPINFRRVIDQTEAAALQAGDYLMIDNAETGAKKISGEIITDKVDWESEGVLGAKNILPYPYYETTKTVSGITYTDNGDGSVTASGTAGGTANFVIKARGTKEFKLPVGKYIVSGCVSGGASNKYLIALNYTNSNNVAQSLAADYGDSASFEITSAMVDGNSYYGIGVAITILSGQDFTTPATFYPMIRPATVEDDSFAEYALTNKEITDRIQCPNNTAGTYVLKATVDSNGIATYSWVAE